jgi:hypothetical protein
MKKWELTSAPQLKMSAHKSIKDENWELTTQVHQSWKKIDGHMTRIIRWRGGGGMCQINQSTSGTVHEEYE